MSAKYFLDTNIFVYCFDDAEPKKRRIALDLVYTALSENSGLISWQVIQEFLNVASKKFSKKLLAADARLYLDKSLSILCNIFPSVELYRLALDLHHSTGYSFYDSLIIAGASEAGCDVLYSEDLQHKQVIRGLKIVNPFI
jgi:predicted nucleic acid-binding protein